MSDGNARAKLALKTKSGLGAAHVFGQQVTSLTREPPAREPRKVLLAVVRLEDVPEFAERAAIAEDLTQRAEQQQACPDERKVAREAPEPKDVDASEPAWSGGRSGGGARRSHAPLPITPRTTAGRR